ncbi:hypothetical protein CR163_006530 [Prosthecochloris sp. ZM_2]|nr:hypothetical protein CR163_006530 [Prosthecochloris sp. ZM_2]
MPGRVMSAAPDAGPSRHTGNARDALNIVLAGFGVAGQLHASFFRTMRDRCRIAAIVDPVPLRRRQAAALYPGAMICRNIDEALTSCKGHVVIDLCVPSCLYTTLLERALNIRIPQEVLIEKPLGWTPHEAERLLSLCDNPEVRYLDTYSCSTGISRLKTFLEKNPAPVSGLRVVFTKDRRHDSLQQRGFADGNAPEAWLIEGPHLASIALALGGPIQSLRHAESFDMPFRDHAPLVAHGGGRAVLRHRNGIVTTLETHLFSPLNRRSVEVRLADRTACRLELPPSGATALCSTLTVEKDGRTILTETLPDSPMEACLRKALCSHDPRRLDPRRGLLVSQTLHEIMEVCRQPHDTAFHELTA